MPRDVFIAIAVSKPDELDFVKGAIPSAQRLLAWAKAAGYETALITDDEGRTPVTFERLHEVIQAKLGEGGQRRIVVSFAGHGIIRHGAEELWFLSRWNTAAVGAINHISLRRRLETYGPQQIAIISDACRLYPDASTDDVDGNPIIDKGWNSAVEEPETAILFATKHAQPAYSTPLKANESYCFFSHILANALCGQYPEAIEQHATLGRVVTQDPLFEVLKARVSELASKNWRVQKPELWSQWSSPNRIWSELGKIGASAVPGYEFPESPRPSLGFGSEADEDEQLQLERAFAARLATVKTISELRELYGGGGLAVLGSAVRDVALNPGTAAHRIEANPNCFKISWDLEGSSEVSSVLVKLGTGDWCGAALYNRCAGTFNIGGTGAQSFMLFEVWDDESWRALDQVARAATGGILDNPYDLAARLRPQKHKDPVLGALAAYAYARVGGTEDIRRLAYFYGEYGQAAPFDIILMARVPVKREGRNLVAEIPAVPEREPRSQEEQRRSFTYEATPPIRVRVAGGFPWLRQGWAYLEDNDNPQFRVLSRFAKALRRSLFTTLKADAGDELAALIRIGEV